MACKCVCNCPLEAGDQIRFKMQPDSLNPDVRINGALELTLAYISRENVIYRWSDPGGHWKGEVHMTRDEFDQKCEAAPPGYKPGARS